MAGKEGEDRISVSRTCYWSLYIYSIARNGYEGIESKGPLVRVAAPAVEEEGVRAVFPKEQL